MFLIDTAWAQSGGGGGGLGIIVPMALIFGVIYLLMIRPQQRRQKAHQAKLTAIQRGDKIVTAGGIFGTVIEAKKEHELQVEIADGVRVRVNRLMVADVINPKAGPPPQQSGGLLSMLFGGGKSNAPAPAAKDSDSDDESPKRKAKKAKKAKGKKALAKKPRAKNKAKAEGDSSA